MIILCWSKQVINRNIISFLCSWIMINVYRACVIDFQSEVSSYNWINFDFNSNIDWISKHSHSFDIKDSSMKVMSVTSVSIRVRNLNIFSKLLKMTSTVNDLKLNESSDMLMKQNMSILLSVTTLTRQIIFWICSNLMHLSCFKTVICFMFWLLAFEAEFFLKQLFLNRVEIQSSEFLSRRNW